MWGEIGAAIGTAAANLYSGRRQQTAANAQAASQMQFERENMQYQNQVAVDMMREAQAYNSNEAARSRDWNAAQASESRNWNAQQSGIERTFNAAEAAKNREFQEYMSGTQYQRAIADMKNAGINPMLAVSQGGAGNVSGSAASTSAPSSGPAQGAQASQGAASPSGLARGAQAQQFNYLASAIASAAQVGQLVANVKATNAQTDKTSAEADAVKALMGSGPNDVDPETGGVTVHAPGRYYRAQIEKAVSEAKRSGSEATTAASEAQASKHLPERARIEKDLKGYEIPKAKADAEFEKMIYDMVRNIGVQGSASSIERVGKLILPLLMKWIGK